MRSRPMSRPPRVPVCPSDKAPHLRQWPVVGEEITRNPVMGRGSVTAADPAPERLHEAPG
jgi:hypothetical protein